LDKKSILKRIFINKKKTFLFNHKGFKINTKTKKSFNSENVPHNKRKVFSVIDTNLWDKVKWKGFCFLGNNVEFRIFIAFENKEYGIKIFDNWSEKFGKKDKRVACKKPLFAGFLQCSKFNVFKMLGDNNFVKKVNQTFCS